MRITLAHHNDETDLNKLSTRLKWLRVHFHRVLSFAYKSDESLEVGVVHQVWKYYEKTSFSGAVTKPTARNIHCWKYKCILPKTWNAKKCTSYTKSRKKPICCKINENNFPNFHEIHKILFQHSEIPGRSLSTFDSEARLNNIFFTNLFFFPFLLLILLHFLSSCKRGYLKLTNFFLAK